MDLLHNTKNIQCGEGGALLLNSPDLISKAHVVQNKGTNRKDFIDGKVSKYNWVSNGSSYIMSEFSAAYLLGQLESINEQREYRKIIFNNYGH